MTQPFLIGYPSELYNLFWEGYINSPDEKRWNISFCPGVVGSWIKFDKCCTFVWDCLVFAFTGHITIFKAIFDVISSIGEFFLDTIIYIPENISESCGNISSLAEDAPFEWIVRIFINLIWYCCLWPIIKFVFSLLMIIPLLPVTMIIITLIACGGKFIIGLLGAIGSTIAGPLILFGGILLSGFITIGALTNRFPKESDNGTYGLFMDKEKNAYGSV